MTPQHSLDEFPTDADQERERRRLFSILEELVIWENSNDSGVLNRARREIEKSTDGNPPPIVDPFCGGGTIPLEAQRLGLKALGGDLNPVAVLISKAMVEIPPRFAGRSPVHPREDGKHPGLESWSGAQGLAEDIRYYGEKVRDCAFERIGHLYPKGPTGETVIAWIWARTVTCPNPACGAEMPLVRSFELSTKKGRRAWVEPVVDRSVSPPTVSFALKSEREDEFRDIPAGTADRRGARCVCCGQIAPLSHVQSEGVKGRIGSQLMAFVVQRARSREYESPSPSHTEAALVDRPQDAPSIKLATHPQYMGVPRYGLTTTADLFTSRQLVALMTFSNIVQQVRDTVLEDAITAGMSDDGVRLCEGGHGAEAYGDALVTYLSFSVSKGANIWSSLTSWMSDRGALRETFARQAVPMVWDFAEANPFSSAGGSWDLFVRRGSDCVSALTGTALASIEQRDGQARASEVPGSVFSFDPPYYDNVPYADLSDFFFSWLRPLLKDVWPEECATITAPKQEELVADVQRWGGRVQARDHFEAGMRRVLSAVAESQHPDFPVTVFYGFRQTERTAAGRTSTGWETFLQSLLDSGLGIQATWPIRTEGEGRLRAIGSNALASSVVLACRPRSELAGLATRSEFLQALRAELAGAIKVLEDGGIQPIDAEQAVIGPGMAIFSRYGKVVEADGADMSVRDALALINQVRQETLSEHEAELDQYTRWALSWFEQHGMDPGPFGDAEQLSKSKNTSVDGVVRAGIVTSSAGKVQLIDRRDLPTDWDPVADRELTVWEATQHLLAKLETGEVEAAALLRRLGSSYGERAATLARIIYDICNRKGWMQEAVAYNGLRVAWPQLERLAAQATEPTLPGFGE